MDLANGLFLAIGIPLWIWAFADAVGHSEQDFQRAGRNPRMFWLITVVVLGPVWGVAYLWYVRPRLRRAIA